jgi:hypothetical protein
VPKPKAPSKGKKAAATTETQSDPSNANADKLKSQSIDATTLRVKEEMINELFLDESFLDEPLDSLAGFEPKLPAKVRTYLLLLVLSKFSIVTSISSVY